MLVLNMLNTPYHRSTPGKVATTTKKHVLKVVYVAKNSKGILVKGLGNVLFYSSSITNVHVLGFVNTQKLKCSKGILVKCFGVCLMGFVNTLSTFSISLLTWYQSGDLPMSLPPPFPTKTWHRSLVDWIINPSCDCSWFQIGQFLSSSTLIVIVEVVVPYHRQSILLGQLLPLSLSNSLLISLFCPWSHW